MFDIVGFSVNTVALAYPSAIKVHGTVHNRSFYRVTIEPDLAGIAVSIVSRARYRDLLVIPIVDLLGPADQYRVNSASLTTLVDGSMVDRMRAPSGLVIDGDVIYVGDNDSSTIFGIDRNTGEVLDWLDVSPEVGSEGLMGLELDSEGRLYVVDVLGDRVVRIAPGE